MPTGVYEHRVKRHSVTQPSDKSYRLIPLTRGQNAIVDAEDFEWLSRWNWCAGWDSSCKTFYAHRRDGNKTLRMHKAIFPDCGQVDHKNRNGLDNRKDNLRPCTNAQNQQNKGKYSNNSSGYKGVYLHKPTKKWQARIYANNKQTSLGYFHDAQDAARAYDAAAKKLHGEFASLNFPG